MTPPKPASRAAARVPLYRYLRLFRDDILSAQPDRLYRAWMAEFRTPFFRSFLVNQPDLIREVLKERPDDFPKSDRVTEGLRPLLGDAVFVTNGEIWARQRRLIDPAFETARVAASFPAIRAAGEAAVARLSPGTHEVEALASHAAADAIIRTMFSAPVDAGTASEVFAAFRAYQRAQPILNLAAFLRLPRWIPRGHRRRTRAAAARIRALIGDMVAERAVLIAEGRAPDDLATRLMTARCPATGQGFDEAEMADQVAILFLAGHETSAAALAWCLYLLASHPDAQTRVADEALSLGPAPGPDALSALSYTRDVFRETLRLYPPVPMMVREANCPQRFRGRFVHKGAQVVISPWHLHRHERLWDDPDAFDPGRWQTAEGRGSARDAFLPFSSGPRVCPGAGFAMAEGTLFLAQILRDFRVSVAPGPRPVPVAYLTVRARDGIRLVFERR